MYDSFFFIMCFLSFQMFVITYIVNNTTNNFTIQFQFKMQEVCSYLTISQIQETILISSELLDPSRSTVVCGSETVTFLPAFANEQEQRTVTFCNLGIKILLTCMFF